MRLRFEHVQSSPGASAPGNPAAEAAGLNGWIGWRRHSCLRMRTGMYSEQVLDHFKNPRNAGELAGATATVELENPACGDVLRLAARVENGVVTAARFKAAGCVTALACGSWLAEWMQGRRLAELGDISDLKISEALGGLAPATRHGAQLAADALRALLEKLAG